MKEGEGAPGAREREVERRENSWPREKRERVKGVAIVDTIDCGELTGGSGSSSGSLLVVSSHCSQQ